MLLLQVQGWGESTKEGLQVYKPASEGLRHQVHTCAWVPLWSSKIPTRKGFSPQGFYHRGKRKVLHREFEINEHSEWYQSLHFIHSTILKTISKIRETKHRYTFDNTISIALMPIHCCPCCGVCCCRWPKVAVPCLESCHRWHWFQDFDRFAHEVNVIRRL